MRKQIKYFRKSAIFFNIQKNVILGLCLENFYSGNKMPTRCNRGFYCRSYCLLNMFRAPLCPSSGAQEYYTVVAACGISCCKNVKICKLGGICVLSIKCRVLSRFVIRCAECRGGRWWAQWCPKHVEQAIRSAIKTSVASSWHSTSTHYITLHYITYMYGDRPNVINSIYICGQLAWPSVDTRQQTEPQIPTRRTSQDNIFRQDQPCSVYTWRSVECLSDCRRQQSEFVSIDIKNVFSDYFVSKCVTEGTARSSQYSDTSANEDNSFWNHIR